MIPISMWVGNAQASKRFVSEAISSYRECLDITLSCVAGSIEVIGSGSSGLQKRQVYGGGRLCYSARRRSTRGRGARLYFGGGTDAQ